MEGLSGKLLLKTKVAPGDKPSDQLLDALDQLESEVDVLKVKMDNRDIVIT